MLTGVCVCVCVSSPVGTLCQWKHIGQDMWQQSETFDTYRVSLYKSCEVGLPGSLVWTVAEDTPDLVYYQVRERMNSVLRTFSQGSQL